MNFVEKELREVLCHWDVGLKRLQPEIMIAGSPERTEFRMVVEDLSGRLLIMERIAPRTLPLKQRIAETLAFFRKKGFKQVQPYLHTHEGKFIYEVSGGLWQVVPYVVGVALNRPDYVFDQWRGEVMAKTLLELRSHSAGVPFFEDEPVFSLPAYIDQLVSVIQKRRPEVMPEVARMQDLVSKDLYPVYNSLPSGFCHGDYHAINIVWGEKGINALIDWEFLGKKPELYDAANMISCLGIEDPECLVGGAVVSFVKGLRQSGVYDERSFEYLPLLVIAMRFAWVSEWLRKNDEEMLRLEFDYFDLLSTNLPGLKSAWR